MACTLCVDALTFAGLVEGGVTPSYFVGTCTHSCG